MTVPGMEQFDQDGQAWFLEGDLRVDGSDPGGDHPTLYWNQNPARPEDMIALAQQLTQAAYLAIQVRDAMIDPTCGRSRLSRRQERAGRR